MKNIDIVYMGNIMAKTGVSTILRSYVKNKKIFIKNNVNLSIFGLDSNDSELCLSTVGNSKSKVKSKYRNKLKNFAQKSRLLSILLIYRLYWYNAAKSVSKYMKMSRNVDVLFFQDFFACYVYLKRNRKIKSKIVLMLHSNGDTFKMLVDYFPKIKDSKYHAALLRKERYVMERVDKIGFVARDAANRYTRIHSDFDKRNVFFVHNGIVNMPYNLSLNEEVSGKIKICCAASISYRKGHDIIVDAVSKLQPKIRNKLKIIFLGDGPLKEKLEKDCVNSGISDCFEFVGMTNDVQSYLEKSNLFILCSRDEGLPMCIIEAMRTGLPVIGTNIAGIPEQVINGENGVLISPNSIELQDVLKGFVEGEYNMKIMGQNSRVLFEKNFTLEKMINSYCGVFNEILN